MKPTLSVITINLNNKKGFEKTLLSVVNQSFKDYEYIIIDGNSIDGSKEIINKYREELTYTISEMDKGIFNAMNKGITVAKGEYLLFLNSGDWLEDEILEKIFSIKHKEDFLYGDIIEEYNNHSVIKKIPSKIGYSFFFHASLPHQATFIKRTLFEYTLYNENYKIVSDWEFFFRAVIFNQNTYKHLNLVVSHFDMNGISNSNQELEKEERTKVINGMPSLIINCFYKLEQFEDKYQNSPLAEIIPELKGEIKFQYISKFIIKSLHLPYIFINKYLRRI